MRGCSVPSFAEDVQTELKLAAESLVPGKRKTKCLRALIGQSKNCC
jgi:hypothetical protein